MEPYVSAISATVVCSFLSLLLWAAQRGKPKGDPERGILLFRHSSLLRGTSLFIAFVMPIGIVLLMAFQSPKEEGFLPALGMLAFFSVVGVFLLWESFRFCLILSPEGLDCRSPWRGQRFIPWDEVEELSFSRVNQWFIIRSTDGWKFRIHYLVPGLNEFLKSCEQFMMPESLKKAKLGYEVVGRPFPR